MWNSLKFITASNFIIIHSQNCEISTYGDDRRVIHLVLYNCALPVDGPLRPETYRSLCIKTLSLFYVCICWSHHNSVKSSTFLPCNTFVMHRKNSFYGLPTVSNFRDCGIHWYKIVTHIFHFTVHRTHIRGLHSPCFLLFDAHVYSSVIQSPLEVLL